MDFFIHVSTLVLNGWAGLGRKLSFFAILSALLLVMGFLDVVGVEVVKVVDNDVDVHIVIFNFFV